MPLSRSRSSSRTEPESRDGGYRWAQRGVERVGAATGVCQGVEWESKASWAKRNSTSGGVQSMGSRGVGRLAAPHGRARPAHGAKGGLLERETAGAAAEQGVGGSRLAGGAVWWRARVLVLVVLRPLHSGFSPDKAKSRAGRGPCAGDRSEKCRSSLSALHFFINGQCAPRQPTPSCYWHWRCISATARTCRCITARPSAPKRRQCHLSKAADEDKATRQ